VQLVPPVRPEGSQRLPELRSTHGADRQLTLPRLLSRPTHPLLLAAALAVGLLLALGVAACGSSGSDAAQTLDAPPLTVGTGATLPSTSSSTTTTSTATTSTTPAPASSGTGGAADTGATSGGATGTGTGAPATGGDTGAATGGGTAPATGGGGTGTTTPAPPSNPGGAAPNFQSFCNENPGAC
jgi:hypothetical protein